MIRTVGPSMSFDSRNSRRSAPGCCQRPLLMLQIGSSPPGLIIQVLIPEDSLKSGTYCFLALRVGSIRQEVSDGEERNPTQILVT